jgi:hypothetical protein
MAPLFAALLAEGSLAWRRKRVEAIEEASAALQELGGGHCSFVYAAWRVDEGTAEERESIAKRDLFGVQASEQAFDCGYNRSANNPFADYLEKFASEAQAQTITFDKGFGWKTSEGLPVTFPQVQGRGELESSGWNGAMSVSAEPARGSSAVAAWVVRISIGVR